MGQVWRAHNTATKNQLAAIRRLLPLPADRSTERRSNPPRIFQDVGGNLRHEQPQRLAAAKSPHHQGGPRPWDSFRGKKP
jgi:hypothetical protein